jgi:hypothetical protein
MNELNWNPSQRQLRGFALIALLFFGALGAWAWPGRPGWAAAAWATAASIGLPGVLRPASVRLVFVLLTMATRPIGWAVSHLIVALLFYGVITSTGLVLRLLGRDPLGLAGQPGASSYWAPKQAPEAPAGYLRQS